VEDVRVDRIELEPRVHAVPAGVVGELAGVLELMVAGGGLDQHRRQVTEVGGQRVDHVVDRVAGEVLGGKAAQPRQRGRELGITGGPASRVPPERSTPGQNSTTPPGRAMPCCLRLVSSERARPAPR
jgi:hypothetical protein